jgi:hypothetical protein
MIHERKELIANMSPEAEDKIIHQLTTFEELVKHLATKEELQKLRVELIIWIIATNIAVGGGLMWYMNGQFSDIKGDIREIRTHLYMPGK